MSLRFSLSGENKSCRLCLRNTEAYINIFEGSFPKMIQDLTSIEISDEDDYPKVACINCMDEVQQATRTRKRILESHSKLQEIHNRKHKNDSETDVNYPEIVILDEFSDDLGEGDEMSREVSSPGLGEILSSYGDFGNEDRLQDFDVKGELISDSNDMTDNDQEDDEEEEESNLNESRDKRDMKKDLIVSKPQIKLPKCSRRQFDVTMLEAIKGVFAIDEKKKRKLIKKPEIKRNLTCDECNLKFENDKYAYYLHTLKHKKSQCKICGIVIRSDNMSKHLDCHTSGPRVCDLCGTTCKNIESLRGHIFYMHRKTADQYKCDQCDRSFRMKYKLELHKNKEHIGVRAHICSTCKKAFFTLRDMNSHIKMKHLKLRPHVCDHCGRGFSSKYALKTHVRQHTNETPYKCHICAEGFRQNVSLRTHLKSKHKIEEAKNYECEFCQKAYSSEFALKVHLRLHGDENYKCEHCDECFQQKIFLINHLKTAHDISSELFVNSCKKESADECDPIST